MQIDFSYPSVIFLNDGVPVSEQIRINLGSDHPDRIRVAGENKITDFTHYVLPYSAHTAGRNPDGMDRDGSAFFIFDRETLQIIKRIPCK